MADFREASVQATSTVALAQVGSVEADLMAALIAASTVLDVEFRWTTTVLPIRDRFTVQEAADFRLRTRGITVVVEDTKTRTTF